MNTISPAAVLPQNEMPLLATNRMHFSRILVATDFSKASEEAVKAAAAISQLFGSKLFLVHATNTFDCTAADATPMPVSILDANLQASRQRMHGLVLSNPQLRKRQPETIIACASPIDLIEEVAKREEIDLIVVGSHGASGIERMAFGSVAESVLRKSYCPVLIVGPHCKIEADPFCSIVLATDLADAGMRAAQYASSLADGAHGKLALLHIIEERSSWPLLPQSSVCDRDEKQLMEELLPAYAVRHCRIKVRVEHGPPTGIIQDVAKEECAGLVVVGLKDRSALADRSPWSTLSHLIRDLHCPVLGVRSSAA